MAFSGGAPAVVTDVFNAASDLADSLRDDAQSFLESAKAESQSIIEIQDPAPLTPGGSGAASFTFGDELSEGVTLAQFLSSRIDTYTSIYANRIFPIDDNLVPA